MTAKELKEAVSPVVHLNGNSRESLIEEWDNFAAAIENAFDVFPNQSFHGRNHYPKVHGEDQAAKAKRELLTCLFDLKNLSEQIIRELSEGE